MARSLFLRVLAIVYLIAFISLLLQVNVLIGSNGILPVSDYLDTIDSEYGNTSAVTLVCIQNTERSSSG